MDIEEKKEKLEHLQKYFVKSFWLSFILLIIVSILCMVMHDAQMVIVNKYFPITEESYNFLVILTLGIWKILVIQFTLIPALVIWCMRRCCCKESCSCQ